MKNLRQKSFLGFVLIALLSGVTVGLAQTSGPSSMELDFSPSPTSVANSGLIFSSSPSSALQTQITEPLPNVYWQPQASQTILPVNSMEASYFGTNSSYGSIADSSPFYLTQAQFPAGSQPEYQPLGAMSPQTNPAPVTAYPGFDPYATPGSPAYAAPTTQVANDGTGVTGNLGHTYSEMKRMLDKITFEYYFAPKSGNTPLGIHDFKIQSRFAFPCGHIGNNMVYITPSFELTLFDFGKDDAGDRFSETLYAAWLDAGIEPRMNDQIRFDLWGRVGVFSDFKKVKGKSIRVMGRGNAYIKLNPRTELALGVIYLGRERIKILPSGGIIWRPSDTVEWRLVFPDPKMARKLAQRNSTEWWWYIRGDYGGNCWTLKVDDDNLRVDYNDIRVAIGLEFRNPTTACADGFFEVGGLFDRELYSSGVKFYSPSTCVFLGAGIYY